jgi:ABC-type glycerol-3-phosphate transport system substrate-binding protein
MKKKTWGLIGLLLLFPLCVVFGGGNKQSESEFPKEVFKGRNKTTVRLLYPSGNVFNKATVNMFQEYVDETGNTLEIIYATNNGWGDYAQKIQTMIAGGEAPDIFQMAIEGFQIFYSRDMLEPFDPFFDKYPEQRVVLEGQHPKLLAPFRVNGELYGLSFGWNNVCTHINLNLLREAGLELPPANWNLATFLEYARKMTFTRSDGTKVYGVSVPNSYFTIDPWLFNNNASILDDQWAKATINSPDAVEVFQFLQDLIYKYEVAPRPPFDETNLFMANQIGMYSSGRWPQRSYTASGFDAVDVMPLPSNKTQVAIFGSGIYPILKSSKNKDAAFLLACKMASEKAQAAILEDDSIAAVTAVMDKMVRESKFPKNTVLFREQADIARAVESPPDYADIEGAVSRAMSKIYANEMSAKAALDICAQEINAILANK